MTDECVTIYTDCDFRGESHQLQFGIYNINYPTVGDNSISSISIPVGWTVTIYTESDLTGESKILTTSLADLGNFNDKISSMSITHCVFNSDKLKALGGTPAPLPSPMTFGSKRINTHNVTVFTKFVI